MCIDFEQGLDESCLICYNYMSGSKPQRSTMDSTHRYTITGGKHSHNSILCNQGHSRASKGIQGHLWASMVNLSNIAVVHEYRDLSGDLRRKVVKEVTSNSLNWLESIGVPKRSKY